MTTPLQLIEEACNDDDTLHAVLLTERSGPELTTLVVREQPARSGTGEVLHLRFAKVDTETEEVAWTSNGIVMAVTGRLPTALVETFARTKNAMGRSEEEEEENPWSPALKNAMNAGEDDLAEVLLAPEEDDVSEEEAATRPTRSPGQEGYWGELAGTEEPRETSASSDDDSDEDEGAEHAHSSVEDDRGPTVECQKCGLVVPKSEAVNFGGGLVDAWVHDGACPDVADGEVDQ